MTLAGLGTLEHKTAVPPSGAITTGDEGVVEALVSITGVVDNVGDLIMPGAYRRTLTERKPKGIFSHDTKVWTARTEKIEELLPGDPRLPKTTKDGKPWPAAAGALYVKCRFNLLTSHGRDAYEDVRFYSETNECEWSIGYTVPKGGAKKSHGVRFISSLDLWEYSQVLFGAAPLSTTLSVKSALSVKAAQVGDEWADLLGDDDPADADAVGEDLGVMIALAIPVDAADALAVPGGLEPSDLHVTLVYLGKGIDADTMAAANDVARQVAERSGPLAGTVGGIGAFPPSDDGTPVYVPVDVPGLEVLRQRLVDALDDAGVPYATNHGYSPHVTLTYAEPGAPIPEPVAPVDVSFDGLVVAVDNDHTPFPFGSADVKSFTGVLHTGLSLNESFEEIRDQVRAGILDRLGGKGHVSVAATFPEDAIVHVHGDDTETAYRVPYQLTTKGLVLGALEPVTVTGDATTDEQAWMTALDDLSYALKGTTGRLETKAGRVLSDSNAKRLVTAARILREILAAAGIDWDDHKIPKPPPQEEEVPAPPSIMPDSTAPSAMPAELKTLTPADLAAGLEIAAFAAVLV